MGCHTTFFKKLEKEPSYEDVQKYILKEIEDMISINQDNPELIALLKRQARIIGKGLCKAATCRWYANWYKESDYRLGYFRGKGFYQESFERDIFRIGGYPSDKLLSLDETFAFIEKHKDRITFSDNWESKLIKFWRDNPDGMIEFG